MLASSASYDNDAMTTCAHEMSDDSENKKETNKYPEYDRKKQRTAESNPLASRDEQSMGKRRIEELNSLPSRNDINDAERCSNLEQDYVVIAQLLKDLDTQVGRFAANMTGVVESMPAYGGLAALWEGMAEPTTTKRIHRSTLEDLQGLEETHHQQNVEELILGDEAEDQDDPLIFL